MATTYYISSSTGSNSLNGSPNYGTNSATPIETLAYFTTTVMPRLVPGDSVLLKRGDAWRNQTLVCGQKYTSKSGDTTASVPQVCSGTAAAPITIGAYGTGANPIIDGSFAFNVSWTLVSGNTYSASFTGISPLQLFVDAGDAPSQQLVPMANATGNWNASTTYNAYDAVVAADGLLYVRGPVAPASNQNPSGNKYQNLWVDVSNTKNPTNTSQGFSTTASGLQNVEATPGSFYLTGSTVYVHLLDGSNPNDHTFNGGSQLYGVLLQDVNYVTVENLTVERVQESGIASIPYSTSWGTYFVGEYNQILNNNIWNFGNIVLDNYVLQGHANALQGGVLVRANGDYTPHLIRGTLVQGNRVQNIDSYFALYQNGSQAGIYLSGMDGGGTANNIIAQNNYVSTINNAGIVYNTTNLSPNASGAATINNGGRVTGNELVNNQQNINFSATQGGMVDHNKIHETYGEGIQLGGNSTSTASIPQVVSYNLIYHVGDGASEAIYNGIDCNGGAPYVSFLQNTIYDTNSASIDLEACLYPTVSGNIFDENALRFPTYDETNPSYLLTVDHAVQSGSSFSDNLWTPGSKTTGEFWVRDYGVTYSCSNFFSAWPDVGSSCVADPQFVSPSTNNYNLQSTSPARGAGPGGSDIGACPYTGGSGAFPCN